MGVATVTCDFCAWSARQQYDAGDETRIGHFLRDALIAHVAESHSEIVATITAPVEATKVLKYGVGYDLVVTLDRMRLVLGIRCHTCGRTSYHPTDVEQRYCGACHEFHDDGPGQVA